MLKLWQIDDGAIHTVAAECESQAFGLYIENLCKAGMDWPDEKPIIKAMDDEKEFAFWPDGSRANEVKLLVMVWRYVFHAPQYIGCSEF